MPWIPTIPPEEAQGALAEAYGWQAKRLGRPTEFTQLGSLAPDVVHARLVLYRASENIPSQLTPRHRLLISYLTSILNATPHCASLARTQLLNMDGGVDLLDLLDHGNYAALPEDECALAEYVEKLTLSPGQIVESDIQRLRHAGFRDLEILDANNSCAHLNYTNRVANGLGLLSEAPVEERTFSRVPS
jgi:uncharacterized peroxidase-related enzyme